MMSSRETSIVAYCAGAMHANLYHLRKCIDEKRFDEIESEVISVLDMVETLMFSGSVPGHDESGGPAEQPRGGPAEAKKGEPI